MAALDVGLDAAWSQLASRPLRDQVDIGTACEMQRKSVAVQRGKLAAVTTDSGVSGFSQRQERVYLPPAWFTGKQLPAILMIGGEFGTPADWIRVGDATAALDAYASAHGGYAPLAVFADATGGFAVDTECVNGPRGNAAEHLTAEVIPEIGRLFGLGEQPKWGVAGFSSGGTAPSIWRSCIPRSSAHSSTSAATSVRTPATGSTRSTGSSAATRRRTGDSTR